MKNHQISAAQLVLMLFLYHSYNMFTSSTHNVTGHYGLPHLLAIPVALAIQVVITLPAWLLVRKCRRGPAEAAVWTLGKAGAVYPLISSMYLLLIMAFTVYSMADFMVNAIYPGSSSAFFIVSMVLCALYAAYLGLEGIARSALIVFVLFAVSLLLTFGGVTGRAALINIPPLPDGVVSLVLEGAWRIVGHSSTIVMYLLLLPYVRSHAGRGFGILLAAIAVLMETVTFFVSSVLGELGRMEAYPFFLLTTIAEVSILQRMDALHVAVWVMVSFLRVALCLWVASRQLSLCLPVRQQASRAKWLLPALAAAAAGIAGCMNQVPRFSDGARAVFSTGIPILLLCAVLPAVCLIAGAVRHRLFPAKAKEGGSE